MNSRNYNQCKRCVMDTSDREINFDGNGFCNHCTEFLDKRSKHLYQGERNDEALEKAVNEIKRAGKGREFDCIIGVSGGIDSSYLAYAVKQRGLRPLAVHMDNGWNSEKAVSNIRNITNKLGIEYESFVLNWDEFKDLQLAFLRASVPEAETPTDMAIPAALHHAAAKYNVKYIISGGNLATEGILPRSWHYNAKDQKYFNYIQNTFGTRRLKYFPTFGYKKEIYFKLGKGIKTIYLLNDLQFDKNKATELLKDELGWKYYGGKHYESRYTMFIQSYYLYEKFGIDYRRATLSTQICTGDIGREQAIESLRSKPYDAGKIKEEKKYIAKKLGISEEELEKIVALPAKWFWDYPNDEKKLKFIYDSYRKLYKKEKLANF